MTATTGTPNDTPSHLPTGPFDRETIREWDRRAIEELGIPGTILMENAGFGAARILRRLCAGGPEPLPPRFAILCGPGNNGGDGYVIARHLVGAGLDVTLYLTFDRDQLAPESDAGVHFGIAQRMGIDIVESDQPPDFAALGSVTLVDGLLGTGLRRTLRAPYLAWVEAANASARPIVALDVPTGLDANTGEILGATIAARHTLTFAAAKAGFTQGAGRVATGTVHIIDIGLPQCLWAD